MREQPCSSVTHPRGEAGEIAYETPGAVFRERVCPVCGRSQGIARIAKEKGPLTAAQRLAIGEQVMTYAGEHYEDGGWDVIVECHTAESVIDVIWLDAEDDHILTFEQARDSLATGVVSVWADREADAENSAF